jgi:outer membrane protein OmpA-like peptidoglycan-associated protein
MKFINCSIKKFSKMKTIVFITIILSITFLASGKTSPDSHRKKKNFCDITIFGTDSSGREITNPEIEFKQFINTISKPLLNYVFFEENSYEIPNRYKLLTKEEAEEFNPNNIFKLSYIDTYYHILNIIGWRLKHRKNIIIDITGNNSNEGMELNNKELSKKRALNVYNYLVNIWGIDSSRIKLIIRNLPVFFTYPKKKGGNEENRRVELIIPDFETDGPLVFRDTVNKNNLDRIYFQIKISKDYPISKYDIDLFNEQKLLKTITKNFFGTMPAKISEKVEFSSFVIDYKSLSLRDPLYYMLTVYDSIGNKQPSRLKKLLVKNKDILPVIITDSIMLLHFNFQGEELWGETKLLNSYKSGIPETVKIIISSFTDKIGLIEYYLKVANARAQKAANNFRGYNVTINEPKVLENVYDLNLPEGRFYARSLMIEIKTISAMIGRLIH